MDQIASNAPHPAGDVSPLKRPPIQPDLPPSNTKKARLGDLSDVAEMVLVLSAMGRMRGAGRSPSEAELEMMREARARIVSACEKWAPRDLVPKEAATAVIDDLGLLTTKFIKENNVYNVNTYNNSKLGFRPPAKLSIKERLALSKKKMEETKEFAAHSNPRSQASSSAIGDNRGTTYSVRTSHSEKSSQLPISSGSLPAPSTLGHVSAASSTSLPYQPPIAEVKVPAGTITHHHGRNPTPFAMPRIDRSPLGLDGGVRTGQAGAPVDRPQVNAPTWSVHPLPPVRGVPEQKVRNHMSVKVETGAPRIVPQAARDLAPKPFVMQATPGNIMSVQQQQPPHSTSCVQAPLPLSNHPEISRIVHKFLQPLAPERPTWTPPSRDYMSKAVGCQMCQFAINEVEGVLVCDACEKGYHMKCLPSFNQKGFPRGEWHCPKCLKLSNGKPLPPKYGRVMRNVAAPRAPGKETGVQQLSEQKMGPVDQKVNQQKMTAIRTSNLQSSHSAAGNSKPLESAAGSKTPNVHSIDDKSSTESSLHSSTKAEASDDASADSTSKTSTQQVNIFQPSSLADKSASGSKSHPPAKSPDLVTNNKDQSQDFSDSKDGTATEPVKSAEVESSDIAEISEGDKGQVIEAVP